jgi:glutamine amidotransferase
MGICLGLQLLFESSEEMGAHEGLCVLPGTVRRFPEDLTVPHMGWNQIDQTRVLPLYDDLADHSYAYFVHSYYVEPSDASVVAATTDYGPRFASIIARENLVAIQFHPEKSQDVGERILSNWLRTAGLSLPGPVRERS